MEPLVACKDWKISRKKIGKELLQLEKIVHQVPTKEFRFDF